MIQLNIDIFGQGQTSKCAFVKSKVGDQVSEIPANVLSSGKKKLLPIFHNFTLSKEGLLNCVFVNALKKKKFARDVFFCLVASALVSL